MTREDDGAHQQRMVQKKANRDKMMAKKTETRGLVILHTGNGKGKTTAALGLALRAIGHGMKVSIIQFECGVIAQLINVRQLG